MKAGGAHAASAGLLPAQSSSLFGRTLSLSVFLSVGFSAGMPKIKASTPFHPHSFNAAALKVQFQSLSLRLPPFLSRNWCACSTTVLVGIPLKSSWHLAKSLKLTTSGAE